MMEESTYIDPMRDTNGYITPEEFETLVSFTNNFRDRVLLSFIFYTGRRVSEVVRCIKPEDFNFKDSMVCFTILKRRKQGVFKTWKRVKPDVIKIISDYIIAYSIAPNEWLFSINRFRVDQILREVGKKAAPVLGWKVNDDGIPFIGKHLIHIHMLRHSHAIDFVKKLPREMDGLEKLHKLMDEMGHGRVDSSNWYVRNFGLE